MSLYLLGLDNIAGLRDVTLPASVLEVEGCSGKVDGHCQCYHEVWAAFCSNTISTEECYGELLALLCALGFQTECRQRWSVFAVLLDDMCKRMRERFDTVIPKRDALSSKPVAKKGPRNRRIDDDYKDAALQAVSDGRALNMPALMKALSDDRG
eukprot:6475847-Amphidinium_carterae.1